MIKILSQKILNSKHIYNTNEPLDFFPLFIDFHRSHLHSYKKKKLLTLEITEQSIWERL